MSSEIRRSTGEPAGSRGDGGAGTDGRALDLIALMSILAVCTLICLLAGTGALQAVIGAAGILFAAWRTPRRSGREEGRRRGPRG
ncbi:hypothetical protein DR950_13100 [Kitasatospora xanthocidica]|uniref:Uncharacterized protein n=2 Tax=Kitasatosporales TaxID=85011 RepID=A0A372ZRR7_9ACTN|nr:hypothetical protein AMK13_13920 [Streptomyces sp. CB02056]RGD58596.1 hypothetical protein DR950_13100 [Kitasatospora xanthocidica]